MVVPLQTPCEPQPFTIELLGTQIHLCHVRTSSPASNSHDTPLCTGDEEQLLSLYRSLLALGDQATGPLHRRASLSLHSPLSLANSSLSCILQRPFFGDALPFHAAQAPSPAPISLPHRHTRLCLSPQLQLYTYTVIKVCLLASLGRNFIWFCAALYPQHIHSAWHIVGPP